MDIANKDVRARSGPSASRWTSAWYLHPAALLAVSFITAAAVFLTGAELRSVVADTSAIVKLLGGAALLFLVGIFFTQQLASRRARSEARNMLERNASDLSQMRTALQARVSDAHKPGAAP